MKKLLSFLLVLAMIMGIGAVSVLAGGQIDPEVYRSRAMGDSYDLFTGGWGVGLLEDEMIEALLPGKSLNDFYSEFPPRPFFSANWDFALCDAVLAEYFTRAFIDEFEAWRDAMVDNYVAYAELLLIVTDGEVENDLYWKYEEEIEALGDSEKENFTIPFMSGELTLVQAAIVQQQLETEVRTLIEKIVGVDPNAPEPTPQKWWQKAPTWIQWILKYLLFGWIWMIK